MAVKLRFKRVGMTKQPYYRLVAVDHHRARNGKEIEVLGHYDPKNADNKFEVKADRIQHWLSVGAQPSDTVRTLLVRSGFYKAAPVKPETASSAS